MAKPLTLNIYTFSALTTLNQIAKKIKLPLDKMALSLDRYGNTDSASIPITLCDHISKSNINKELKILASVFGPGLSWGVMNMELPNSVCLPIITTNQHFDDGTL